ncbi:hypothetical protein AVEN_74367-1 [Araneus ventricosus]|uniref:Uncharacterized protein n=1 Tax=Araneus ventricosus TaxID=182803 RepID=A0A4Y2SJP0_ARAVE|nr:hypothetical protein AVEN_74367-1 [Araneus ventricosus]
MYEVLYLPSQLSWCHAACKKEGEENRSMLSSQALDPFGGGRSFEDGIKLRREQNSIDPLIAVKFVSYNTPIPCILTCYSKFLGLFWSFRDFVDAQ